MMEVIKKTILQAVTTGTTTGCTGNCYVIIPDLSKIYYFKISLVQEVRDLGFYSAYVEETNIKSPLIEMELEPSIDTQVATSVLSTSLIGTGGCNIVCYDKVSSYGMEYNEML